MEQTSAELDDARTIAIFKTYIHHYFIATGRVVQSVFVCTHNECFGLFDRSLHRRANWLSVACSSMHPCLFYSSRFEHWPPSSSFSSLQVTVCLRHLFLLVFSPSSPSLRTSASFSSCVMYSLTFLTQAIQFSSRHMTLHCPSPPFLH